jgi:hypothetical protein
VTTPFGTAAAVWQTASGYALRASPNGKRLTPLCGTRTNQIGCVHRQLNPEVNMTRRVFYSFHYVPDNWRASQVRNMGAVEGNQPAKDNDWETVTKGGDKAIEKWISGGER